MWRSANDFIKRRLAPAMGAFAQPLKWGQHARAISFATARHLGGRLLANHRGRRGHRVATSVIQKIRNARRTGMQHAGFSHRLDSTVVVA